MKKLPSNTADGAVRAMAAVRETIEPPYPLPDDAKPIWDEIIASRTREEWKKGIERRLAYELARCLADLARERALLDQEGTVIDNKRGTPVANPRFAVCETLTRRIIGIQTKLRIHAGAEGYEPSLVKGKRESERVAAGVLASQGENPADDFFAMQ